MSVFRVSAKKWVWISYLALARKCLEFSIFRTPKLFLTVNVTVWYKTDDSSPTHSLKWHTIKRKNFLVFDWAPGRLSTIFPQNPSWFFPGGPQHRIILRRYQTLSSLYQELKLWLVVQSNYSNKLATTVPNLKKLVVKVSQGGQINHQIWFLINFN